MPDRPRRSTRKSSKPTMAAVAKAAGVSVFTVSAVVNGTAQVSAALRQRVEEAIEATGYKRNAVARSLKTGRTMTIGVVVGHITNPFYTDVVAVLQQVLHEAGYEAILSCSNDDARLQAEHISRLRDRMVDGLIVSPVGEVDELRTALSEVNMPVVQVDGIVDGLDCDAVIIDNRAAVGEAIQYLLSLGHRHVGLIAGRKTTFTGREREAGYESALRDAGIEVRPELIQLCRVRSEDAYKAALRLLTLPQRPTAIFAANNLMLIGLMKAVHDLGLNCPRDISIVGLDDFPWTEAFAPQLTTVAQPVRSIGEQAARLLLQRLSGADDEEQSRRIVLHGELKVRGSCRPTGRESAPN